jgi:hypothetical protein
MLVLGVRAEEGALLVARGADVRLGVDVGLAAVDHADPAVAKEEGAAFKHLARVGAAVHQVQLRQHADGALALRVKLAHEAHRVRRGDVGVGRRHRQDDHVLRQTKHPASALRQSCIAMGRTLGRM